MKAFTERQKNGLTGSLLVWVGEVDSEICLSPNSVTMLRRYSHAFLIYSIISAVSSLLFVLTSAVNGGNFGCDGYYYKTLYSIRRSPLKIGAFGPSIQRSLIKDLSKQSKVTRIHGEYKTSVRLPVAIHSNFQYVLYIFLEIMIILTWICSAPYIT